MIQIIIIIRGMGLETTLTPFGRALRVVELREGRVVMAVGIDSSIDTLRTRKVRIYGSSLLFYPCIK